MAVEPSRPHQEKVALHLLGSGLVAGNTLVAHDLRVLERWRSGPPWALGLGMGSLFAAGMFLFSMVQGYPWVAALVGAALQGVFFGAIMGPWVARQRRRAVEAVGGSGQTYRAAARSLSWRAPRPQTDAESIAAADLARQRLQVLDSQRVWGTLVFVGISAIATWLALTRSPWWWLEVLLFVIIIIVTQAQRRRLRRIVAGS